MSKEIQNKGLIHIISPGFNCAHSVRIWYNSLKNQTYRHWVVYAIDDASDDTTYKEIEKISKYDKRVIPIRRPIHYYQLGNWYKIIHQIGSNRLVVRLDLDDSLGSKYVLEQIIKEYWIRECDVFTITEHCLSTMTDDNCSYRWNGKSKEDVANASWTGDSLFCFNSSYFLRIPKEHFLDEEGNFVRCAGDIAITFPILYQGIDRFHHLYIPYGLMYDDIRPVEYNDDNLKTSDGQRLQFYWRDIFDKRFKQEVKDGIYE